VNHPLIRNNHILITGATGFIGHYLLAALVRRNVPCAVLVRPPVNDSFARLARMLNGLGLDLHALRDAGRVAVVQGDLRTALPDPTELKIHSIVHAAASTRFETSPAGEPQLTNVTGTIALLRWAQTHGINDLHLVSSAYRCGIADGVVEEMIENTPPRFHNPYERTKWQAERACARWAGASRDRKLTIYRPSVVVGEYTTGRATRFSGFYLSARATQMLAEQYNGGPNAGHRHHIPLRIRARAKDQQNIVPVDYVAAMIAHGVLGPAFHGKVYHLTHPDPPDNALIKRAIEHKYDIAGGRFVDPDMFDPTVMNEKERLFYEVSRPIEHYFVDTPTFDRRNADALESAAGVTCPSYDERSLIGLLNYAQRCRWGRESVDGIPEVQSSEDDALYDAYFRSYLPDRVSRSKIARMTGLSVTMRFILEDVPNGQWVCRFERGVLTAVHRGENTFKEDFSYRTRSDVFWRAIAGGVHPQAVFLDNRARVTGDTEQALKMAMILHGFNNEFPCDREALRREAVPA
jgi:nucleoside-diphosphate-sugar epimerase/predicted lipid carrier protein YhbT